MIWKLALDFGLRVTCPPAAVILSLLFTTLCPFTLSVCICPQLRASARRHPSGQIGKRLMCLVLISRCLPLNPHTFSILDRFDCSCPSPCFWESSGCGGISVAAWGPWPNGEVLCVWCLSRKVLRLIHMMREEGERSREIFYQTIRRYGHGWLASVYRPIRWNSSMPGR